jgi:hypothetical protein
MIVALAAALMGSAIAQDAKDHNVWLGEQLKKLQSIKPGMTRAEVEKIMRRDGGISLFDPKSPTEDERYIGKECQYCKATITFRKTGDSKGDVVEKVSKPYLEHAFYD